MKVVISKGGVVRLERCHIYQNLMSIRSKYSEEYGCGLVGNRIRDKEGEGDGEIKVYLLIKSLEHLDSL